MRRILFVCVMFFAASSALAVMAIWTGRLEYVTTITGQQAVRCEYDYVGKRFWVTMSGGICPPSINVN